MLIPVDLEGLRPQLWALLDEKNIMGRKTVTQSYFVHLGLMALMIGMTAAIQCCKLTVAWVELMLLALENIC